MDRAQEKEFNHTFHHNCIHMHAKIASNISDHKKNIIYQDARTGCVIAAWARIDYQQELLDKLKLIKKPEQPLSPPQLILNAYLSWGDECCTNLFGDYSFVIYDPRENSIFCGRDHIGARPFYYINTYDAFIFSTSISSLHLYNHIALTPKMSWIAEYMTDISMDFSNTAYNNAFKLEPSHTLLIKNQSTIKKQYHCFDYKTVTSLPDQKSYIEFYKERVVSAVKNRTPNDPKPFACEVSGGLDSSSILGIAANKNSPLNIHTFSSILFEKEPEFLSALIHHHNLNHCHISPHLNTPQKKNELLLTAINALGYPVEHWAAEYRMPDYEIQQKHSLDTVLSGFGGDEFVTSRFTGIILNQLLQEKNYKGFWNNLNGKTLKKSISFCKIPILKNFQISSTYTKKYLNACKQRWPLNIVNDEYAERHLIKQKYFAFGNNQTIFNNLNKFILTYRWKPYVTTRLENCALIANNYNVEYAWPLLDIKLIEAFLSIPVELKNLHGISRYIHRKATEPFMPKKVAWKNSKSMGAALNPKNNIAVYAPPDDGYHPLLKEVINIDKYREQIKKAHSTSTLTKGYRFQIKLNNIKVSALNTWLHRFHK
ncbi:MAG: asparagine synthase-related protein [Coxiellaceae bacterium]|nr:asparagine synthase-related protein [Coxiellaceae bacterium]